MANADIIALTADIVSAHVSNNQVASTELPALIQGVFAALDQTTKPVPVAPVRRKPAVPIRSSVKYDYLVCLEDGAKVKLLRAYLLTRFDLTPDEYRKKWKLPANYPMVAPAYTEQRSRLAKARGLGRKKDVDVAPAVEAQSATTGGRETSAPAASKAAPGASVGRKAGIGDAHTRAVPERGAAKRARAKKAAVTGTANTPAQKRDRRSKSKPAADAAPR